MAACLLAPGVHRLDNVPVISDVAIMSDVLRAMGAEVVHDGPGPARPPRDHVPSDVTPVAPYELVEKMRASIVVLGPLLARYGSARVSMPGGDDFGYRPIDFHLSAFEELGASFVAEHGYVEGDCDRLVGARIVLQFPSHTATDNILMAAVLAKGTTVIENAAREPEISDLAVDADRDGGAHPGRRHLAHRGRGGRRAAPGRPPGDPGPGGGGHLRRRRRPRRRRGARRTGARPEHMDMLLREAPPDGHGTARRPTGASSPPPRAACRSVDVATLPYPGVATDYKPLLVTLLSVADGVAIVSENLFAGRFRYIDELRRMGAKIKTEGHHAIVRGVPRLSGAPGAGAGHPRRGRARPRRPRRRRRHRGERRRAHRPRLRGLRRAASLPRCGHRARLDAVSRGRAGAQQHERAVRAAAVGRPAARSPGLLSVVERGEAARPRARRADLPAGRERLRRSASRAPRARASRRSRAPLIADVRKRLGDPVAVLAVDPSSPLTGGAILGDRVRMQDHALDDAVFIRSMATRGHLGGLAAAVPEAVRLLDATGWPLVIVETVGVGQVEVEVAATCDTVVVVVNPGWGDAVQANKAGLLEVADVLVINKADRPGRAGRRRRDLRHMLELSGTLEWTPPIVETVASTGEGVAELWDAIASHREHLENLGELERRRARAGGGGGCEDRGGTFREGCRGGGWRARQRRPSGRVERAANRPGGGGRPTRRGGRTRDRRRRRAA